MIVFKQVVNKLYVNKLIVIVVTKSCMSLFIISTEGFVFKNSLFHFIYLDNSPPPDTITVGPVTISVDQLKVAFTSSMIVIPPNLLIVTLFKKAGPKLKMLVETYKFKSQETSKTGNHRYESHIFYIIMN